MWQQDGEREPLRCEIPRETVMGCGERERRETGERGRGGEAVVTRAARPLLLCLGLLT